MAKKEFEIVIRSGAGRGASIDAVVEALRALEQLHEAAAASVIRPGSGRVKLPERAKRHLGLAITKAEPKNSLNVAVALPEYIPGVDDDGFVGLPESSNNLFEETIRSAAEKNAENIIHLYPEKADRLRVLQKIADLSGGNSRQAVEFVGLGKPGYILRFTQSHKEWAEQNYPTMSPDEVHISGLVKIGALSGSPKFTIYDGKRSINILPNSGAVQRLSDLFGRVAEISGTAHYRGNGEIKYVTDLTYADQFTYRVKEISTASKTIHLRKEIIYKAIASQNAKEFMLENEELHSFGYGRTLSEAMGDADSDFIAQYESIALAKDSELHESALPMKSFLLSLVADVEVHNE